MSMEQFFSKSGQFISSYQYGTKPPEVQFNYENGYSQFDGRNWNYHIFRRIQ